MTLDEAIAHAREVAENVRYNAYTFTEQDLLKEECRQAKTECLECAAEHEQLAAWLEELKQRREADRWISVKERLPEQTTAYLVTIKFTEDYEECIMTDTVIYNIKYGWNTADEVIAWKPMPKPYESEAENEANN